MNRKIILLAFIGLSFISPLVAMDSQPQMPPAQPAVNAQVPDAPPAQQQAAQNAQEASSQQPATPPSRQQPHPVPDVHPAQQQIQNPAMQLRQHFTTILTQFATMPSEQIVQELTVCHNALTALQASITQYQTNPDLRTANVARVTNAFFETLKTKISTCRNQIAQLPPDGQDWLEQADHQSQRNAIRVNLAQIQSQLNTLFRILGGEQYRLAPTQEGEHAIAMQVWQEQQPLSVANIIGRTALSYGWTRLLGTNNAQTAIQALNAAKQEADNLYTDSIIAQRNSATQLYDLAGRLGGYGLGRYNWTMPYLIEAANRFLPTEPDPEQDQNKRQINKIRNLLYLFDDSGRINGAGRSESALPIEHPWLMRSIIRFVPTRFIRWGESIVRTANAPYVNDQNWASWLKVCAAKQSSSLCCAFMRAALGRGFNSFEGSVLRGVRISDAIDRVKGVYRNPLGRWMIDQGIDWAYYCAPEIRAGSATINGWLANWKACSPAENIAAMQTRATIIPTQRDTIHAGMRLHLDGLAQQWRNGQVPINR